MQLAKLACIATIFAATSLACEPTLKPCLVTANFSTNLEGDPDTRPSTWGMAKAQTWTLQFTPLPNTQVEILEVSGDLVAWPTTGGLGPAIVEPGRFAGVLFGLQTTEPEGSTRAFPASDNTLVYIQDAVAQEPRRASFDRHIRRTLPADNKIIVKVAVWLNDTGYKIHIEPTFTIKYRFVPANYKGWGVFGSGVQEFRPASEKEE